MEISKVVNVIDNGGLSKLFKLGDEAALDVLVSNGQNVVVLSQIIEETEAFKSPTIRDGVLGWIEKNNKSILIPEINVTIEDRFTFPKDPFKKGQTADIALFNRNYS